MLKLNSVRYMVRGTVDDDENGNGVVTNRIRNKVNYFSMGFNQNAIKRVAVM